MRQGLGRARLRAAATIAALAWASSTAASSPSLIWTDAKRVAVRCLVQSSTIADASAFEKSFCERVARLASRGAPSPVLHLEVGDPALSAGDTVVLLVHASIERASRGRTLAFTIRPHRPSANEDIFFGTAPRVTMLPSSSTGTALNADLRAALADVLPWMQSNLTARPL